MKNIRKIAVLMVVVFVSIAIIITNEKEEIVYSAGNGSALTYYSGETEATVFSREYLLDKGYYSFNIKYKAAENGCYVRLSQNQKEIYRTELSKETEEITFDIELGTTMPNTVMEVICEKGYLEIWEIGIRAESGLNNDSYLLVGALWSIILMIFLLQKYWDTKKKTVLEYAIVVGSALAVSASLFSSQAIYSVHDLGYHLMRIEGIAECIQTKQLPAYIYPYMRNGNGYLNVLYPSLFLYIPAVLRVLGVSLVSAYKAFLVIINVATALSMYYAMKTLTDSGAGRVLATILYLLMRYRLNNIFSRGALGETLALIFLPLIIAGTYHVVCGDRKKWTMLVIGMTGTINSHILSSILYAGIVFFTGIVCIKNISGEKRYIEILKAVMLTIGLNLFFIIPFILYYFNNELMLDALNVDYESFTVNISHLFGILDYYSGYRTRDYSLRLPVIFLLGVGILYVFTKKSCNKCMKGYLFLAIVLLILATNIFPYQYAKKIGIIHKLFSFIQFPYRFIGPAVGIIIMIGTIGLIEMVEVKEYFKVSVVALIAIAVVDTSLWNLDLPEMIYSNQNAKTESADIIMSNAYNGRRCWGTIDIDYEWYPREYLISGSGETTTDFDFSEGANVSVSQYVKDGTNIYFTYQVNEKSNTDVYVDFPLMNYWGYVAYNENHEQISIETNKNGNIQLALQQDGAIHNIDICFREPIECRIAEFISVFILIGYIIFRKKDYLWIKKVN